MEDPINGTVDIELSDVESGDALAGGIPAMNFSLDTDKYNITKVMPDVILAKIRKPQNVDENGWVTDEKSGLAMKADTIDDGVWKVAEVLMVGTEVETVEVGDLIVVAGEGSGLKAVNFDGTEYALTREELVMYVVEDKIK